MMKFLIGGPAAMTLFSPNKLYKDPRNGKIMGVCAGVADYTGIKVTIIRIAFIIGCFIGWFPALLILYFVMGFVLDAKPADLYKDEEEESFWRTARTRPDYTATNLSKRFKSIDKRIQSMERYMTSKRFKLDRDLRGLED